MPDNKPYALENAINSLQSTNGQQNEQIIKQGSEGLRNDTSLHKTMKEVLAEFRGSRGDNEEARRDGKKKSGGATPAPSGGATPEIEGAFDGLGSLATIGIAFSGFVTGLVQGWFGAIKSLGKVVKGTFNFFGNTMKKIITKISNLIGKGIDKVLGKQIAAFKEAFSAMSGRVAAWFSNAVKPITKFLKSFKVGVDGKAVVNTNAFVKKLLSIKEAASGFFTGIGNRITAVKELIRYQFALFSKTKVGGGLLKGLGAIKTFLTGLPIMLGNKFMVLKDTIMKPFKVIGDAFGTAKTALFGAGNTGKALKDTTGKMGAVIEKMKTIAPGLFKAFATLGRLLGWPLTIAIGLFHGIKASIEKFKSGDIIGGVMAFLTGAINGAIMSLVDMVKDGLSWVMGALGFDKISEFLDSFSFEEMFSTMMFHIEDFINRPGEKLGEMMDAAKAWWEGFDFMESVKDIGATLHGLIDDAIEWIKSKLPSMDTITGFFGKLNPFSSDEEVPVAPETTPVATPTAAVASTQAVDVETIKVMKTVAKAETNPKKPVAKADTNPKRSRQQIKADKDRRADDRLLRDEEKFRAIKSTGMKNGQELDEDSAYGQRILSNNDNKLAKIEAIKAQRGGDLDGMSRENAQAAGGNNAVMIAPQTSTVTNNSNSNTAAIIDQNLPTQDHNDRSFHDQGFG